MNYHGRLQTDLKGIARASTTLLVLGALACSDAGPEALSQGQWPVLAADTELTYTPVTPCRIVDTQKAGGAITPSASRDYVVHGPVSSQGGDADDCTSPVGEPGAVHVNITVIPQGSSGTLRAYPFDISSPMAGIINFKDGNHQVSNAAIVKTCHECSKDITIDSHSGTAHVIIDVLGYFADNIEPLSATDKDYVYTPVSPCRILDTRNAGGVFAPDTTRRYAVYGDVEDQGGNTDGCPSPRGEPRAAHISLAAVPQSGSATGTLSAFPATADAPDVALMHYKEGAQVIANAAIVQTLHDNDKKEIDILNEGGKAHLVVDVLGYYHSNTATSPPADRDYTYVAVTPCRILDTRNAGGAFDGTETREIVVYGDVSAQGGNASACGSPLGEPRAAHINVTAVPKSGKGNLVLYETDKSTPTASVVNYDAASQNIANAITVRTTHDDSAAPDLKVTNRSGKTDLVIDVLGYFHAAIDTSPGGDAGVDASSDAGADAGAGDDASTANDVGLQNDSGSIDSSHTTNDSGTGDGPTRPSDGCNIGAASNGSSGSTALLVLLVLAWILVLGRSTRRHAKHYCVRSSPVA